MGHGLVSIITPVYNAEKQLSRCIDSILNQTYKEIELILVNDGSTDSTPDICNLYARKDKRVKVFSQVNSGPSVARNTGIGMAEGEYVQFVDADDTIDSLMTEKLMEFMSDDVDLVVCGYHIINLDRSGHQEILMAKPGKQIGLSQRNFIENFGVLFENHYLNYPWNKLYRAEIIKNNDLMFNESIRWGEDLIFNLQYFEHCKVISILDSQLYNYMVHSDSITTSFNKDLFIYQQAMYREVKRFLSKYDSFAEENKKVFENKYTNAIVMCLANLFHSNSKLSSRDRRSNIKKILNDPTVMEHAQYLHTEGLQKRVLSLIIKARSVGGIILYFKVRKWTRGTGTMVQS